MPTAKQTHRALLPAPIDSHSGGKGNDQTPPSDPGHFKAKRTQVSVACESCRVRKAKCNGQRPQCASCRARGHVCRYSADENMTRMTTLKRKYQVMSDRNDELEGILNVLRDSSCAEASAMLDRLRSGTAISPSTQSSSELTPSPLAIPGQGSPALSRDDSAANSDKSQPHCDDQVSPTSIRERMRVDALLVELSLDPRQATKNNDSTAHRPP